MSRTSCTLLSLSFVLMSVQSLRAERYALLIGISTYSAFPSFHLSGPKEDVHAIHDALVREWQFPEANIICLVDEAATKRRILEHLDKLVTEVRSGDQVFIYFSGHGTSALDPRNQRIGLPLNSGALIPYDVQKAPPEMLLKQFIIGAIDLRPRFTQLDAKASIFVVIDSCYSGAAVKSVADTLLVSRDAPLSAFASSNRLVLDDYDAAYNSIHLRVSDPDEYPYRHVIFLSAAAESEKAYEATESAIKVGAFQTVDGKPHGLLTDSLLRAFQGEADADHDGKITYEELHRYVYTKVMQQGQTPQLYPKDVPELTRQPIFGTYPLLQIRRDNSTDAHEIITVSLSPAAEWLAPQVGALPNVRVGDGSTDLAVMKVGDNYALHVANGVLIREFRAAEARELLDRVRREPDVKRLRQWSFERQSFHAALTPEPDNRDTYAKGEQLAFHLSADRRSYLLLLNIDVTGTVTIVYKSVTGHPARGDERLTVNTCVTPPVGTEYMKLFAFLEQPPGWEALEPASSFPPDDNRFRSLISVLEKAPNNSAQASWLTYTTDRRRSIGEDCTLK